MSADTILRQQVLALLDGRNAHATLDDVVAGFPPEHFNTRPPNVPYSPWHLLEHIRIAQWDILEFIRDPNYKSPPWPEGYWPAPDAQADEAAWNNTLAAIRADMAALKAMVQDPARDLTAELPHAPGYTLLREALLVADHNAYHIGEFGILRQVMGTWPPGHE
ncbi:MAG: DinB family protein [Chloroflexi bacterium]|nr:DinB family protein [Chloroflexota bacterium]